MILPRTSPCKEAAATGEWHDPLIQYDQEGLPHRPPTFRSSTDDASIGSSSIDGLLINTVALFAMDSIEIVDYQNKCHLQVKATFKWQRLQQTGWVWRVWQRPAALDLGAMQAPRPDDPLCPHQQNATSLWVNQYAPCTADSLTSDQWLQRFNDLAVDTLLLGGAKWLHGHKSRGAPPRYKKTTVYNGQLSSGDAATKDLRWIQKTLAMTNEALFRTARQASTPGDIRTTANLLYKLRLRVFSASPSLPNLRSSWMEGLAVVRDALTILATTRKESLRSTRIKEWRNKIKENCRSTAVGPVVFKYLRKKVQKHPANLLEDQQGNIITDPPKALAAFAEKWDEVFSANILLPREEQVLAPIIPLIETVRKDIALPTLGAIDFFQQAQARRKDAAGGMDGWATRELQCLPPQAFIPLAELFHRVELGQLELPSQMTLARQIILDKGGPDVPLAKRLICILPVTMVLYTSLRYKQLGQWQAQCLPRELYGGVPGRRMCDLTTQIKLDLDKGHATHSGLIGVKLDKTKCFDRLTPRISALLMLAFGLPLTLVRVFLGLYNTAKRVVFYTRWALPTPISTASGVFQGCSLSLLCINLHMAVWALILRNVPQIKPFAFIDDSYILGDKDAIPQLQLAVDLTRLWDNLTGQALNEYKCNIFASSPGLRNAMRLAFPAMNMVEIVEILGSYLQTSRRNQTGYPKPKVAAALTDCKLIATLPTTLQVREHLLATKVIPRIAFTPGMTRIPKAILEKLQSAIAETIWKDRPMWRSRGLLFAVLANPHRTEPICARAYITLLETMDYLNRSPGARDTWETLFEADEHLQSSLIMQFSMACALFDIEWSAPFQLNIWGRVSFSFLGLAKSDIKVLLQKLCAHRLYSIATTAKRKDVSPAEGFFDKQASTGSFKWFSRRASDELLLQHLQSMMVGCTPTADRTYAAGTSTTSSCRFCDIAKEDSFHLVHNCPALPAHLERPPDDFWLGPNFQVLGLVETPWADVTERLQISSTADILVEEWSGREAPPVHLWTDGSVVLSKSYWKTRAAYAVIDSNTCVVAAGKVHHWALSSYTAELFAILVAFASATGPCIIHTDSLTIVQQFQDLLNGSGLPHHLQHYAWWRFLFKLIEERGGRENSPLHIVWCPAHSWDHLPLECISDEMLGFKNLSRADLTNNRKADLVAKEQLEGYARRESLHASRVLCYIQEHHLWLAKLHKHLSEDSSNRIVTEVGGHDQALDEQPSLDHKALYPRWAWDAVFASYTTPSPAVGFDFSKYKGKIKEANWTSATSWMVQLKWQLGDSYSTSFLELAAQCFVDGLHFVPCGDEIESPKAIVAHLRATVTASLKLGAALCPGSIDYSASKCNGHRHPNGTIRGAKVFLSNKALHLLATGFEKGATAKLSTWAMLASSLL